MDIAQKRRVIAIQHARMLLLQFLITLETFYIGRIIGISPKLMVYIGLMIEDLLTFSHPEFCNFSGIPVQRVLLNNLNLF